jgi:preprotein translocase subunit SecY
MISAFTNSLKIPELRQKLLLTFGMIFVARMGANLPLPGLNPRPLEAYFQSLAADSGGGIVALYNMFTGGALLKGAIFGLGVMPYISASIILQLMGAVVPQLARLQQEGDVGRQKISQYTRYLTLLICVIQAVLLNMALVYNPGNIFHGFDPNKFGSIILVSQTSFLITSVIFMTAGTMILMWIGEQITQKGIGNGISILITIGILADLPQALQLAWGMVNKKIGAGGSNLDIPQAILMVFLLVLVIAGITAITQAVRKIPVQYAKRVVGRKVYGGQSSFLPLKVNYAGVMPVIFASAILMFPQFILGVLNNRTLQGVTNLFLPGHWPYYMMFGTLIFVFSYFWVSIMFRPIQIADDLKKNGGYVPGVRPGDPTAKFLDFVMTRLTFAGAFFLTAIALMPNILSTYFNIDYRIAHFFGGTGTLIAVGVMLDTMRQIETYLLQRHYDGFLKKGRIRGRSVAAANNSLDTSEIKNMGILLWPLSILFLIGIVAWAWQKFNM